MQQAAALHKWQLAFQDRAQRRQHQQKALQRLLNLVLANALDGFVAVVQRQREMRKKKGRIAAVMRSQRMAMAWNRFVAVTQTGKGRRQRAARVWLHACGNTMRAAIDGWRDG
eukprot:1179687-Rhodomonas_salina.1